MIQHFPMFTIDIIREEIPVDTMSPRQVPDKSWNYIDKNGHGHFWEGVNLPTLEWVVTGTEWVGDEFDAEEIEVGEWRCKHCAEVINPKKKATYAPRSIPGLMRIIVTIEGETFVLTEALYAQSVEAWHRALHEITGRMTVE